MEYGPIACHMHPKIILKLFKKNKYVCTYVYTPNIKIEDDNPRQFDVVSIDL